MTVLSLKKILLCLGADQMYLGCDVTVDLKESGMVLKHSMILILCNPFVIFYLPHTGILQPFLSGLFRIRVGFVCSDMLLFGDGTVDVAVHHNDYKYIGK